MGKDSGVIQSIYDTIIRPWLPYKISVHNGVPVKSRVKLLDFTEVFPDYEDPLISSVRRNVEVDDHTVIVGGGLGVSTIAAVRASGVQGEVTTFEGSRTQYETVKQTLSINDVENQVDLRHTIVGSYSDFSLDGWGEPDGANVFPPNELPDCDVLELDCEGVENEILSKMEIRPRVIIVETHDFLNSPKEEVIQTLRDVSYEITNTETLDEERGIDVLTAKDCE